MNNKQMWKAFFELEESFCDYVIENCDELYSQNPPVFTVDPELSTKAPKYIRWIGRLKHDSSDFKPRLAELQQAYQLAVGESFKSYPVRFCEYLERVDQINITINRAFRSRQLTPGFFTVLKISEFLDNKYQQNEFARLMEQLHSHKIESKISADQEKNGRNYICLKVNAQDVFNYFETKKIQIREESGRHFRARARFHNESAGERIKFGFIVVDQRSTCHVVESNDQAERPHTLVKKGRELFLPVDRELDIFFFDKS